MLVLRHALGAVVARFLTIGWQLCDDRFVMLWVTVFLPILVSIGPSKADLAHSVDTTFSMKVKVSFITGASTLTAFLADAAF